MEVGMTQVVNEMMKFKCHIHHVPPKDISVKDGAMLYDTCCEDFRKYLEEYYNSELNKAATKKFGRKR